jgi:hypothetical protein
VITKTVTITNIDMPKSGDKYPRYTVHYTGDDGSSWKIGNLVAKLGETTRAEINAVSGELKEGKKPVRNVSVEKEGQFWNLVDISQGKTVVNKKTSTYQPQSPEDKQKTDTKIQVMNALTNAVNSLGVGKTTKEYKDRVFEFVELGNDVVDAVLNKTTPNKEPIIDNTIVDDIDEDLGF